MNAQPGSDVAASAAATAEVAGTIRTSSVTVVSPDPIKKKQKLLPREQKKNEKKTKEQQIR